MSDVAGRALDAIERLDPVLRAFVHVDPDAVRRQAAQLDARVEKGTLHGVTIGVKDVFDTADAPTELGSPIFRGRRPDRDAAAVALLRDAGALVVGKTATAELACMSPATTRNPHDNERTPGGSSSGSAAAVAAGMVTAALGTQTAGSISRPASFCGVVGYKPTFGTISRSGVVECAQSLDTVGVLAGGVPVAAAVASVMMQDPSIATVADPPPGLRIAVLLPHAWAELADSVGEVVDAVGSLLSSLGAAVETVELPAELHRATDVHGVIMRYEIARSFAPLYEHHREELSDELAATIEEGLSYDVATYAAAQNDRRAIAEFVAKFFESADAVIAPAASGEAPLGLDSTGDPACAAPWTMVGVPMVTVPAGRGEAGLPIGASVIGPVGGDRLTLSIANAVAVSEGLLRVRPAGDPQVARNPRVRSRLPGP